MFLVEDFMSDLLLLLFNCSKMNLYLISYGSQTAEKRGKILILD